MPQYPTVALNTPGTGYESRRIIQGKTFHVLFEEIEIHATVDDVWAEVSGNFVNGADIAESLSASHGISGDLTEGLGAERYLGIKFNGKTVEAKERIIDYRDGGDIRDFTYDVYETKGAPIGLKSYITWYVRPGEGKTAVLGNAFAFRANVAILTGLVGVMFRRSNAIRGGLLTYKHYLETGEKKVSQDALIALYPSVD